MASKQKLVGLPVLVSPLEDTNKVALRATEREKGEGGVKKKK